MIPEWGGDDIADLTGLKIERGLLHSRLEEVAAREPAQIAAGIGIVLVGERGEISVRLAGLRQHLLSAGGIGQNNLASVDLFDRLRESGEELIALPGGGQGAAERVAEVVLRVAIIGEPYRKDRCVPSRLKQGVEMGLEIGVREGEAVLPGGAGQESLIGQLGQRAGLLLGFGQLTLGGLKLRERGLILRAPDLLAINAQGEGDGRNGGRGSLGRGRGAGGRKGRRGPALTGGEQPNQEQAHYHPAEAF